MELRIFNPEGRIVYSEIWADPRTINQILEIFRFAAGI